MTPKGWRSINTMDVGQKRDWSTGMVIGWPEEEPEDGSIWQTAILGMLKLRSDLDMDGKPLTSLLDITEEMCLQLFDHFSSEASVIDATRDTAVADWVGRRYGRSSVEPFIFSTKSHVEAWHSTIYYVQSPMGYGWPAPAPGSRLATWVGELQDQMMTEEVRMNDRGQWVFRHPGPHNDWLAAFEMGHWLVRRIQNASSAGGPMCASAQGAPPWTQDPKLRPPILAQIDARSGRRWGRPKRPW